MSRTTRRFAHPHLLDDQTIGLEARAGRGPHPRHAPGPGRAGARVRTTGTALRSGPAAGGNGSRVVLEVRSHKVPFILEDGQIIGRLVYEPLTEAPERVYGQGIGSNYQRQGLALAKQFKQPR